MRVINPAWLLFNRHFVQFAQVGLGASHRNPTKRLYRCRITAFGLLRPLGKFDLRYIYLQQMSGPAIPDLQALFLPQALDLLDHLFR